MGEALLNTNILYKQHFYLIFCLKNVLKSGINNVLCHPAALSGGSLIIVRGSILGG
jgi:hypothetical protein